MELEFARVHEKVEDAGEIVRIQLVGILGNLYRIVEFRQVVLRDDFVELMQIFQIASVTTVIPLVGYLDGFI